MHTFISLSCIISHLNITRNTEHFYSLGLQRSLTAVADRAASLRSSQPAAAVAHGKRLCSVFLVMSTFPGVKMYAKRLSLDANTGATPRFLYGRTCTNHLMEYVIHVQYSTIKSEIRNARNNEKAYCAGRVIVLPINVPGFGR